MGRPSAALQVSLGDRTAGSAADQGGCGGAGQQDGADRLGRAGQGRAVSGANTLRQSYRGIGLTVLKKNQQRNLSHQRQTSLRRGMGREMVQVNAASVTLKR